MNSAVSRTVIVVIVIWVARVPATIVRTGVVWSLWEVIGPTVKCLSQWFPEACGLYHLGSCLCCGQTQRGCLGREARGRAKRNARVRDTDDGCCTFTGTLDCCEFCGEMCFYWCYLTCVFAGDDICCCCCECACDECGECCKCGECCECGDSGCCECGDCGGCGDCNCDCACDCGGCDCC